MSAMDQVIKEINGGTEEQTNTFPATTETQPAETAPAEQPKEEPKPKPKKDLSNVSPEDKAAYSFRKQAERRERKMKDEMNALLDDKFKAFSEKFGKPAETPKAPEPRKKRTDFDSDADYIDYLTDLKVKAMMEERDAKAAKDKEAADAEAANRKAEYERNLRQVQAFRANLEAYYKGDDLEGWKQRLTEASKKGFGKIIDASPLLRNFIVGSRLGPVLLDKLVSDPSALKRLTQQFSSPIEYQYELMDIAREALAERQGGSNEQPKEAKPQAHIGRPGAGSNAPAGSRTIFSDDDKLIQFMRKRGRR